MLFDIFSQTILKMNLWFVRKEEKSSLNDSKLNSFNMPLFLCDYNTLEIEEVSQKSCKKWLKEDWLSKISVIDLYIIWSQLANLYF